MTRQRAKELLPVIQAWAEGKAIEYKTDYGGDWTDFSAGCPLFYQSDIQWRIKPEPRRFWIAETPTRIAVTFSSKEKAVDWVSRNNDCTIIEVQEVLP